MTKGNGFKLKEI